MRKVEIMWKSAKNWTKYDMNHVFVPVLLVIKTSDIRRMYSIIYIYIYAFSRRFYPKRLTVHSGYTFNLFFHQYVCSQGIEPTTFALLMQCFTTEPQEHCYSIKYVDAKKKQVIFLKTAP